MKYNVGLTKKILYHSMLVKQHKLILKIQQILGSHELTCPMHFWPCPPKNRWNNFYLSWLCTSMQKIISIYWFILEILSILDSCYLTGHAHFLTMSTQRFFDQLLIYVTLYQHARHQPISLTNSGDTADEKIMQSDWLIFWPIKEEQRFSQIWDLGKNTANNMNFHYRTNSIKTNDQILHSKNLVYWPNFSPLSQFWRQNKFLQNIQPCYIQFHISF